MTGFRAFLSVIFVSIVAYTSVVVANHGMGLLPIFLNDIVAMTWRGQFNLDFTGFLVLSAFWLAWRNQFSPLGLVLGVLGFFGGAPVLTAYLLVTSFAVDGDVQVLLLGPARANA